MRKITAITAVGWILLSGAAWADKGFHYVATTETTGTQMKKPDRLIVESWVEGPNAKIAFTEVGAANPLLEEGKYLLTNDGGETIYLVDPKENTHARFDLSQILGMAGSVMDSDLINMDVSNHRVEELESRGGPPMHGYDTRYRKYRTSYDLEMKIMGMKRADHYVMDNEVWSVDGLQAAGFQAWMRPRKTGFDAVDKLLEGEIGKVKGFPFKTVTVTTSQGKKKNRTTTTTSTTVVDEFKESNIDNAIFVLNPDSREIQLVDLGGLDAQKEPEEQEEEKGGFMKRLNKKIKGDG